MCDRSTLQNIDHLCGEGSAPDLQDWLAVTSVDDIVRPLPNMDATSHKFSGDFVMRAAVAATQTSAAVAAGKWQKWEFSKSDNGLDMGFKDGYYEPKIEIFVEQLDEFKTWKLMKARGNDKAVIVTDNNGKPRFMDRAMIEFDETTKSKNGYKITISCGKRKDPLPYYYGSIVF